MLSFVVHEDKPGLADRVGSTARNTRRAVPTAFGASESVVCRAVHDNFLGPKESFRSR